MDFTADLARAFLIEDLLKVLLRTKYLYVDVEPKKEFGPGYFEPLLLGLCWCDFLGALYCGQGRVGTSTLRSKRFIGEMLGELNPRYAEIADDLVGNYRHGVVHAYAPLGNFEIAIADAERHLLIKQRPRNVTISISHFLTDLAESVRCFAGSIVPEGSADQPRTLAAFNRGRRELLNYVDNDVL